MREGGKAAACRSETRQRQQAARILFSSLLACKQQKVSTSIWTKTKSAALFRSFFLISLPFFLSTDRTFSCMPLSLVVVTHQQRDIDFIFRLTRENQTKMAGRQPQQSAA
mmetsp:Transcript_13240/g.26127  ORF Transcript_13240/g.26127 Transcript_13240/m.26127 type:complete len:110 (+) Transcript_13240:721-1050(+)